MNEKKEFTKLEIVPDCLGDTDCFSCKYSTRELREGVNEYEYVEDEDVIIGCEVLKDKFKPTRRCGYYKLAGVFWFGRILFGSVVLYIIIDYILKKII